MTDNNQLMPFDFSGDETPSIIKVIGVGGGGGMPLITCIKKAYMV